MATDEQAEARVRKNMTGLAEGSVQIEMDRRSKAAKERQIREGKGPQHEPSPDVSIPVVPTEPRLYQKYKVLNRNGERLMNCFVLRPDTDRVALEALHAYADNQECPPSLAADIKAWLAKAKFKPTKLAD